MMQWSSKRRLRNKCEVFRKSWLNIHCGNVMFLVLSLCQSVCLFIGRRIRVPMLGQIGPFSASAPPRPVQTCSPFFTPVGKRAVGL